MRALGSLLAACLALGCAEQAPPAEPTPVNPLPDTGGPGPLDALSRRFGRLRARMVERGYGEELGLSRLFVLEGEGLALPADLMADRCTTLVGLAGGSVRELRMSIYDGEGAEVAADSIEGEGALVHVCPQTDENVPTLPHYVVLRAREGSGAVVVGAFASAPGAGQGFEGLFEGVLAPRVPFRAVEEQLARSRALLRARGLLPQGAPALESVAEGEAVRVTVPMESGRCYVVVGRGGEGLRDIDLLLFDDAGAEVARDLEGDAEPTIEHCPAEAGTFTAELIAYEGAGAVGLMVLAGPVPEREEGEPAPVPEEPAREPASPETPQSGEPVAALMGLARTMAERGYGQPTIVVRDGYIAPGEVRSHDVLLAPGCSIVVGAAGRAEADLDLYLSDASGQPLDRDTGIHPMARVRACTEAPAIHRVTVKSYGRRGTYALAVLPAPKTIGDVQTLRLEEASSGLRQRGFRMVDTLSTSLEVGERFERGLLVPPGRCVAIVAAGDVGVEDLDVLLRDRESNLVASASGPEPYAAVHRCASEAPEALRVEVVMYRGAGAVQVTRMEGTP